MTVKISSFKLRQGPICDFHPRDNVIHVTRSPFSNPATSSDKLDDAAGMQDNGNQILGELHGEQPREVEMGAVFSSSRPSSGGDPRCVPSREIARESAIVARSRQCRETISTRWSRPPESTGVVSMSSPVDELCYTVDQQQQRAWRLRRGARTIEQETRAADGNR